MKLAAMTIAALIGSGATPAVGQHMNMPGMTMPMPVKPVAKKRTAKNPAAKTGGKKRMLPKGAPAKPKAPTQVSLQPADSMDHGAMKMPDAAGQPMPRDHAAAGKISMGSPPMTGMDMDHASAGHEMAMTGVLGRYPMMRESSGTAWQPDNSGHMGVMTTSGDWTLMAHSVLNLVADHQSSDRGDDKMFASGMLMGMARRPLSNGTLQLRAALSPDPLMGKRGYPLLLASGETANGSDRLIDRQHPHDLFMELSASVSQNIGRKSSLFVYAGLPGEPAFGPPAFMHRESIMDSPEAPISHHWLDSIHISFGVLTAGIVADRFKLEVSRFNAREPDQDRWNIETGPLDSTAIRLTWNPNAQLSLQGSWGHFRDPEQLEPGADQRRWSASVLYARELAPDWRLASTLAWGRKTILHHGQPLRDDAVAGEASLRHRQWTIFARAEMTENGELVADVVHGPAYRVGKISLGAVRDVPIAKHWSIGAGGSASLNFIPQPLASAYGTRNPLGAMGFVRLKLQ